MGVVVRGSTINEGVVPPKTIGVAAGMGVGLGTGTGIVVCAGGGAGLGTGEIVDVDVDVDARGAGAKGAGDTRDVDEDVDISTVALPGGSGVRVTPLVLVEAPPHVATFALEPDGPASAGPSSRSNSLSIVLELDKGPFGAVAASNVFHLGFSFCALFAYSFLPFFPAGGAATPLYVAEPGLASGGSPSFARQRGARMPKSGTAACIGSSFSPPPWMAGSRGKS